MSKEVKTILKCPQRWSAAAADTGSSSIFTYIPRGKHAAPSRVIRPVLQLRADLRHSMCADAPAPEGN